MSELRIGVAGATGALGQEIIKTLDTCRWRPDTLVPLASPATKVSFVSYGDSQVAVDDLRDQAFDELDGLFLALPAEAARAVGEAAAAEGVSVVDCTGAFAQDSDVPLVVPWINMEALQDLGARGVIATPHPAAGMIAALLGPLLRAGLAERVRATILLPASSEGRDGIDELSRQVVALFNSTAPPRKIFEDGLAFDLLPLIGDVGEDGWSDVEHRVASEVARLTGMQPTITLLGVPVFSGLGATVEVGLARTAPPELVRQILLDGGVGLPKDAGLRYLPRPRRVEGKPFVQAGRLRFDASGALHIWLSMDNLKASATAAVACGRALFLGLGR